MRKIYLFLEQAFAVLALIIYSGGVLTLLVSGGTGEVDVEVTYDTSSIRIFYFSIYLITFALLLLRWRKVLYIIRQDKFLWILVVLPLLSILWSFDRAITIKDSITMVGSSMFGLYLSTRYSINQQLQLLAVTTGIVVFLSLIFAVALPHYGMMQDFHAGAMRGVYTHKNGLGQMMGLGILVFIALIIDDKKSYFAWIGLVFSVLVLALAKSTASVINVSIAAPFFLMLNVLRLRYHLMMPALLTIVTIGFSSSVWLNNNLESLAVSVGKDPSITGRTPLWGFVWEMIQKQPWLGYGYGGFWQGWDGQAAQIWRAIQWTPNHPHNGLLALWIDLGLLGVIIFAIGFWRYFVRSLAYIRIHHQVDGIWPLLYLIYMVLINLTETNLFSSNSITWILYIACYHSTLKKRQFATAPL
jgi:exopolysaccharide production protein ExoQ